MAQSSAHTWTDGEVLTHTDLNAMNTNILNNGLAVVSPLTGNLSAGGFDLLNVETIRLLDMGPATTAGTLQRDGLALSFYDGTRAQTLQGTITPNTTTVGNIGTGEDQLMGIDFPAGFFAVANRAIIFTAGFHFAANAATKTLKVRLGAAGTYTLNSVTTAPNNIYAMAQLVLCRTGTNTQMLWGKYIMSSKADPMVFASWTETEANALSFRFTGQATTTDDIRQFFLALAVGR